MQNIYRYVHKTTHKVELELQIDIDGFASLIGIHFFMPFFRGPLYTLAESCDFAEEPFAQLRVNVVCACAQHNCKTGKLEWTLVFVQIGQDSARHQYAQCENQCSQHHQPVAAARMQLISTSQTSRQAIHPTGDVQRSTLNEKRETENENEMQKQNEELPK